MSITTKLIATTVATAALAVGPVAIATGSVSADAAPSKTVHCC